MPNPWFWAAVRGNGGWGNRTVSAMAAAVRGRASVRVKASLPVISPLEDVGTLLLSSLQRSTFSDGINVHWILGRNPVDYQVISIRDRVDP